MYIISDKPAGIKAVQGLLGIKPSGIYNKKTEMAVKELQRKTGLRENGRVNYETFLAILENRQEQADMAIYGNYSGTASFPYVKGMNGDEITQLHVYISNALDLYAYDHIYPKGSYYNTDTEKAVIFLREIFGLGGESGVDSVLYTRIKREIFAHWATDV